jgi:hypothetical protein
VLILAAIPALAGFMRGSLIGYADQYVGTSRIEISAALSGIVVEYGLTLGAVYVLALIIDSTAPLFGAARDSTQAFKLSAYSQTATWVAGVGKLLPSALSSVLTFLAAIYGVYLLYVGLPYTMKSSERRSAGYASVIVIAAIFLNAIMAMTVRSVTYSHSSHHIVVGAAREVDGRNREFMQAL